MSLLLIVCFGYDWFWLWCHYCVVTINSLNLEHNSLTTFSGLIHLNNLKVHVYRITAHCFVAFRVFPVLSWIKRVELVIFVVNFVKKFGPRIHSHGVIQLIFCYLFLIILFFQHRTINLWIVMLWPSSILFSAIMCGRRSSLETD